MFTLRLISCTWAISILWDTILWTCHLNDWTAYVCLCCTSCFLPYSRQGGFQGRNPEFGGHSIVSRVWRPSQKSHPSVSHNITIFLARSIGKWAPMCPQKFQTIQRKASYLLRGAKFENSRFWEIARCRFLTVFFQFPQFFTIEKSVSKVPNVKLFLPYFRCQDGGCKGGCRAIGSSLSPKRVFSESFQDSHTPSIFTTWDPDIRKMYYHSRLYQEEERYKWVRSWEYGRWKPFVGIFEKE